MNIGPAITDLRENGFCLLKAHLPSDLIASCREALWPGLLEYLKAHREEPNRGPFRHFLPMPFEPPCFRPEFFFDPVALGVIHSILGPRVVADQWGCDVPVRGSQNQEPHVDYQRPLFSEAPELTLPPYMLVVSFGLVPITPECGPIQIAPGTHRMPREDAARAVLSGNLSMRSIHLDIGDVLIRHPWALHRGTPNTTDIPRALATIRYVRSWYIDNSREVNSIPCRVWQRLTPEQQAGMRFPVSPV